MAGNFSTDSGLVMGWPPLQMGTPPKHENRIDPAWFVTFGNQYMLGCQRLILWVQDYRHLDCQQVRFRAFSHSHQPHLFPAHRWIARHWQHLSRVGSLCFLSPGFGACEAFGYRADGPTHGEQPSWHRHRICIFDHNHRNAGGGY